jgi:hypothetical protein
MDVNRFDAVVRGLGTGASRRGVLALLGSGALAGSLTLTRAGARRGPLPARVQVHKRSGPHVQ